MTNNAMRDLLGRPRGRRVLYALLPPAVAALIWWWRGETSQSTTMLAMVLVVVAAASTGDRVAGVVAAASSAVAFDFFFTDPYLSLAIRKTDDLLLGALFIVVALAMTELALRGRRQLARSNRQSGYIEGVVAIIRLALTQPPPDTLRASVCNELIRVLQVEGCRYADGPPAGGWPVVDPDGTVRANGRDLDVSRSGLPTDTVTALPVTCAGAVVGHFQITSGSQVARPSRDQLNVAVLLAQLVRETSTDERSSRTR